MSFPFTPRPLVTCPVCQGQLQSLGRVPIRKDTAQTGVITTAQPGDPNPVVPIDAYRCHSCGRLEFYDHDFLLPAL